MKYIIVSDIGLIRQINQDAVLVHKKNNMVLAIVCDGIGGANAGDIASTTTISIFKKELDKIDSFTSKEDMIIWFETVLNHANTTLQKLGQENKELEGMGTTLIGILKQDDLILGFNVGDSRIYTFKDNTLSLLSNDQTFAYEMYLRNEITYDELRHHPHSHVLMNAVGAINPVTYELIEIDNDFKYLLLCSDGLSGYISDDQISEVLQKENDLEIMKQELLDRVYNAGAFDNISFIILVGEING